MIIYKPYVLNCISALNTAVMENIHIDNQLSQNKAFHLGLYWMQPVIMMCTEISAENTQPIYPLHQHCTNCAVCIRFMQCRIIRAQSVCCCFTLSCIFFLSISTMSYHAVHSHSHMHMLTWYEKNECSFINFRLHSFQQTIINKQLSFVNEEWTKITFKHKLTFRSVRWKGQITHGGVNVN